jgi:hypothetical protein
MSIKYIQTQYAEIATRSDELTVLQKYFLMRFHPIKMIFDIVGAMWAVYFLWIKVWPMAFISAVFFGLVGLFSVRHVDLDEMSQTTLGKMGLLHAHPVNLTLNLMGLIPLVYGLWEHSTEYILIGLTIVYFGHLYGWEEVNPKLRAYREV